MLNLKQIQENYSENLRGFKKNILREYLQYKILEIIFNSIYANKLSFLGGTALRVIYGNSRFSEDLDFDNLGLSQKEFARLAKTVEKELQKQGYAAESCNVFKGAYRCYIKLPKILFANDLSGMASEKIIIQLDTVPHNFAYKPDKKILNKFDVFSEIFVTPPDILLSQKIYAALNRKRGKGRDFYDIVFLSSFIKPNYEYLRQKVKINNSSELKKKLIFRSKDLNFNQLIKDVGQFLLEPSDSKKIKLFPDYIKQIDF